MSAKYILAALSLVFLVLGLSRATGATLQHSLQGRIWLFVGVVFALVSVFLFMRQS